MQMKGQRRLKGLLTRGMRVILGTPLALEGNRLCLMLCRPVLVCTRAVCPGTQCRFAGASYQGVVKLVHLHNVKEVSGVSDAAFRTSPNAEQRIGVGGWTTAHRSISPRTHPIPPPPTPTPTPAGMGEIGLHPGGGGGLAQSLGGWLC